MDPKVRASVPHPQAFLMVIFHLGGREETRVPEEGRPAVPPHVVMFWDQSDSGHDVA